MLQGAKVRLRELLAKDLDKVWRWRNDLEVTEFLSNLQISRLQIDIWFKEYEASPRGRFFAIETLDGHLIGYTGLRDIDWAERTAMMDIIIGEKDYWGKGYGQDAICSLLNFAFSELDLNKVSLSVLPFNTRAIRCYEKCGFRRVGFFRDTYFRRNKLWHSIRMEVTPMQFKLAMKERDT